jgi:hypothetical protein
MESTNSLPLKWLKQRLTFDQLRDLLLGLDSLYRKRGIEAKLFVNFCKHVYPNLRPGDEIWLYDSGHEHRFAYGLEGLAVVRKGDVVSVVFLE